MFIWKGIYSENRTYSYVCKWFRRSKKIFIKYLNATSNEIYRNKKKGFWSYFLSFLHGARLEIMNKPQVRNKKVYEGIGSIHVAFCVGSAKKVDEITKALFNDGFNVVSDPRTTGDCDYGSCIIGIA